MISARGRSFCSMSRSMIATSGAEARTVIEFCVLFAKNAGTSGTPGTRITAFSSCTTSCASACER